jgi:type VI protein secretion system component VasF
MTSARLRATAVILLLLVAQLAAPATTAAHSSGPDATPEHVLLEVAQWGLAVAAVLGLVVLLFWARAKRRGEDQE